MENRLLEGKSVIVTGASSGIGAHITRVLVAGGARVTVAARRRVRLEDLAEELAGLSGDVSLVEADVTKANDVERMVQHAVDRYGGIDALVNNAGMEIQGRIEELSEEALERMLRTNVVGPYLCLRAALPYLKQRGGSVVNVGSTVVTRAPLYRFGYVASKGALEAMSRALSGDLGPEGVRVNVVRPGIVPSELRGTTETEEMESLKERVPRLQALPNVGTGMDVAAAVAFLVSDDSRWITGTVLDVDGGYSLGTPR
ncbi:MAG: SDR family NAD(P)-dependent oxidoreductase [Actinomycetota bacterium]